VKRKLFKIYLAYGLAGLFLLFGLSVLGQRSNPFEIIPRLGEVEQQPVLSVDSGSLVARSNNPFDIVSDPVKAENNNIKTIFPPVETPVLPKGDSSVFRFILVVFILSMVAFLLTILRSVAVKSFSAFLNNNMLNQLYREQEGRGVSPFVLLYVMFLMNVGIFLYFCMDILDVRPINNEIGLFFLCLGASFGLFFGKALIAEHDQLHFSGEKRSQPISFFNDYIRDHHWFFNGSLQFISGFWPGDSASQCGIHSASPHWFSLCISLF
jgi:hypothetical protein